MNLAQLRKDIQILRNNLDVETDNFIESMNEKRHYDEVNPLYIASKKTHSALTEKLEEYGILMEKIAYSLGFEEKVKEKDLVNLFETCK
jgi:hypothetical protein